MNVMSLMAANYRSLQFLQATVVWWWRIKCRPISMKELTDRREIPTPDGAVWVEDGGAIAKHRQTETNGARKIKFSWNT